MKSAIFGFIGLVFSLSSMGAEPTHAWTRQQILDYVNRSPLFVDQHNKKGWVGLFTEESFIQDPVGGYTFEKAKFNRHFQQNQVEMFWDAFIAKNDIKFIIKNDIVSDLSIIRDAVVDAYLPPVGEHVLTNAHLRYNLMEVNGQLRVKSLQAYWNLPTISKETLARGKVGSKIMSVQIKNTVDGLGVGIGLLGHFLKASVVGVNQRGQKTITRLIASLNAGNSRSFSKGFHSHAQIIFNSDHSVLSPQEFAAQNFRVNDVSKMISSGNSVAFNFQLTDSNGISRTAVGIANFKNLKVETLEIFVEGPPAGH